MLDLGNLYTAALPAWLATGFEQALDENQDLTGRELLTLGYGSGDAAEVIPLFASDHWKDAAAKIGFGKSMEFAIDLNKRQYEALHDGRRVPDLDYVPKDEFVIEKVGRTDQRQFQDIGIEYYRYVG
jgi:hydroxymethylglutaryl-CoA synthase